NVNTCLTGGYNSPYDSPLMSPTPTGSTTRYSDSMPSNGLPNCEGSEVNNFAVRAVTVDPAQNTGCLPHCQDFVTPDPNAIGQPQVSGMGRLSTFVNATGANRTVIYLAKIDHIFAGKWLLLKMFDPGDLTG